MSMKQTIKRVMDAHGLTGTPGLVEYTCELLAELSKDEPVGYRYVDHNGHWRFNEMKFGDIAEPVYSHHAPVSASEQKPVAYLFEDGSAVIVADMVYVAEKSGQKVEPLFTSPPNTADIEQRVAEACAKYCDNLKTYHVETGRPILASVAEHAAHYLRGGIWREYQ